MGNVDCSDSESWCFYTRQCHLTGNWEDGYSLIRSDIENSYWCRNVVYCEDLLHIPEYGSAITAIFISLMALWQLSWDHPVAIMRFLSGCFFLNGITSAINHYTGSGIFSFLDNATMYLPLFIMIGISFDKFNGRIDTSYGSKQYNKCYYWRFCSRFLLWVAVSSFIVLLLFNDWVAKPNEIVFVCLFGSPLLLLVGMGFYVYKKDSMKDYIAKYYHYSTDDAWPDQLKIGYKNATQYFVRGVVISGIFGALWLITEPLCVNTSWDWLKYIFAHSLWHIGMSYGLSLVLLYFTFIECVLRGHLPQFTCVKDVFFQIPCSHVKCDCKQLAKFPVGDLAKYSKETLVLFPILFVKNPNQEASDQISNPENV